MAFKEEWPLLIIEMVCGEYGRPSLLSREATPL
jgi:hypothetical protein